MDNLEIKLISDSLSESMRIRDMLDSVGGSFFITCGQSCPGSIEVGYDSLKPILTERLAETNRRLKRLGLGALFD
jgi:hypothetical protein